MPHTTERQTIIANARIILDRAKADQRELTAAEADQVEAAITHVKDIDGKVKSGDLVRRVMALGGPGRESDPEHPGGLFDAEAKAGMLAAIRSKTSYRAEVPRTDISAKAAITGAFLPTAGEGVAPALYPNVGPVAVTELMQTVPVSTPVVRFYQLSSGTAAVVPEGTVKPPSGITATAKDVTLAKIAALLEVTDELSQDAPWMLRWLQAALVGAVIQRESQECVATFGGASGILTKTGAAADVVDIVADAIAGMQSLGTNPSAIFVTPTTLATIRKAKAQTSGTYLAVDPLAAGPTTLHGIPLYPVPVAGANTGWVIDGTGLAYYRRSEVTFELGYDGDSWSRNVRVARAETRGKCGVLQPLAVTKITLTP